MQHNYEVDCSQNTDTSTPYHIDIWTDNIRFYEELKTEVHNLLAMYELCENMNENAE